MIVIELKTLARVGIEHFGSQKSQGMQILLISAVVAILCSLGSAQLFFSDRILGRSDSDSDDQSNQAIFYIATRRNPERVTVYGLDELEDIFEKTDLNLSRKTIVIVHGILSSANAQWVQDLQDALLDWDDVNVISVDWSIGSVSYKIPENAKTVAIELADFVEIVSGQLDSSSKKPNSIHLIGHSVGAHICGYASQLISQRRLPWMVKRITGLDPCRIFGGVYRPSLHLDKSDAPFVDVIHTNSGGPNNLGVGMLQPIGHSDFYVNGGRTQPGCEVDTSSVFEMLAESANTFCSHMRAYEYFIESVKSATLNNNCIFPTYQWKLPKNFRTARTRRLLRDAKNGKQCTEMGINSDKYPCIGTFFVETTAKKPYCFYTDDSSSL